jgi:uncharacterized RDD family membrane protein YckC
LTSFYYVRDPEGYEGPDGLTWEEAAEKVPSEAFIRRDDEDDWLPKSAHPHFSPGGSAPPPANLGRQVHGVDMATAQIPALPLRVFAALIDHGLLIVFFSIWFWFFADIGQNGKPVLRGVFAVVPIAIWFLWLPLSEAWVGQTLGKRLFDLRVVSKDGDAVSMIRAILRHLLDGIEFYCLAPVGILVAFFSDQHRRLGDHVAGTVVIRNPNLSFQADRDPRSRGPRPLNSNR